MLSLLGLTLCLVAIYAGRRCRIVRKLCWYWPFLLPEGQPFFGECGDLRQWEGGSTIWSCLWICSSTEGFLSSKDRSLLRMRRRRRFLVGGRCLWFC